MLTVAARPPKGAGRIAILIAGLAIVVTSGTSLSYATEDVSSICERVSEAAAAESGVPVSVLKAISLTETGRKRGGVFRPWPWTVNMEGEGHWFETLDDARAYVFREYKRGARSFDVGCFQINYKWHGDAFDSIDEMFDPMANARYAARYLSELHAESGSWTTAAGSYHSRTPEFAERYRARFERFRTALMDEDGETPGPVGTADESDPIPDIPDIVLALGGAAAAPPQPRINNFPLLRRPDTAGAPGQYGSLVPLAPAGTAGRSLFGPQPAAEPEAPGSNAPAEAPAASVEVPDA
jgi:hypothetical protein